MWLVLPQVPENVATCLTVDTEVLKVHMLLLLLQTIRQLEPVGDDSKNKSRKTRRLM
jgi:hypothetical protein